MPPRPHKLWTLAFGLVALAGAAAGTGICKGKINVGGLIGDLGHGLFASGHGGGAHHGNQLTMKHNSGISITKSCKKDWDAHDFKTFTVLGKTLSFSVDLSKVGCACNLGVFFVPLPARDLQGTPSKGNCSYVSYYCDASAACGRACPELDLMQANKFAFAATPRKCESATEGHYGQCDRDGCGQNTNSMGVMDYGPGAHYTIDTTRPFEVQTDFYGSGKLAGGAVFSKMVTRLEQGAKVLRLDHASCSAYFLHLANVMAAGMSLRVAYWGKDARTMAWLDEPPCSKTSICGGADAGQAVVGNITISDLEGDWVPTARAGEPLATGPSAQRLLENQEEAKAGWLPKIQSMQLNLVNHRIPSLLKQLWSMPEEKVGMLLVGASVLFCIPGLIALLSYYARQSRYTPSKRNLVSPITAEPGETYAVTPKVFPVRPHMNKGGVTSFFRCCCRRSDIPYSPFQQSELGGRAGMAEWQNQYYPPQGPPAPHAYFR